MFFRRDADLPQDLAVDCVEGPQPSIHDWCDDFALVQRDAAVHNAAADSRLPDLLIHFGIGTPDFLV
jgi:hypothetical protein